jgi:hypothetical protein
MNEGSGDSFFALAPNNNTITASNITWGTGIGVTSPIFGGTNSSGIAANDTLTNFDGTKPFSVSLWVNPASLAAESAFVSTLQLSSGAIGWEVYFGGGGAPGFFLINDFPSNAIDVTVPGPLVVGTTTNIVWTYDGSQRAPGVSIYVDGVLGVPTVTTDTLSASTANGQPLLVGARLDGSTPFDGSMGDLQIFGTALTQAQVNAIVLAGPQ